MPLAIGRLLVLHAYGPCKNKDGDSESNTNCYKYTVTCALTPRTASHALRFADSGQTSPYWPELYSFYLCCITFFFESFGGLVCQFEGSGFKSRSGQIAYLSWCKNQALNIRDWRCSSWFGLTVGSVCDIKERQEGLESSLPVYFGN